MVEIRMSYELAEVSFRRSFKLKSLFETWEVLRKFRFGLREESPKHKHHRPSFVFLLIWLQNITFNDKKE